jgi:hypothetical protein
MNYWEHEVKKMANIFRRKETSLLLIVLSFLLVVAPYFLEIEMLQNSSQALILMVSVLNAMSILLAIYSQTRRSLLLVNQRAHGWVYQVYLLIAIYLMAGLGFLFGQQSDQFMWFQYAILNPTGSVIYSSLAFFMASASARAFRARSPQAALLLISGIFVLLGQAPISAVYVPFLGTFREYLTSSFSMAAARIFAMSVTVGAVVLGVRMLTGRESEAIGFEGG